MYGVDTALQSSELWQRIPIFETPNKLKEFSIAHINFRWNLNFQNVPVKKIAGFFCAPC